MRQIWQTIINNRTAGIVFVCAIVFLLLFLWKLIDPASYTSNINGFMRDVKEILSFFIALFIIGMGFAFLAGWRPFGKKKSGGH